MRISPGRSICICAAAALGAISLFAQPSRTVVNSWEIHDEIRVRAGSEAAVKDHFPSFLEYQDLVMFHPKFGYYASGRVNFSSDYQTFPIVLHPYFGQMAAEQIYRMWQGMRRAGTLDRNETFTIAEFGAGNGMMAEAILDYLERQSGELDGWKEFAAQARYVCYDRSPALSETQRKRNARFGKRFEARQADATDPVAAIPAGSLKGVVLSNELPDAFSVYKTILGADGTAETAFVAPAVPKSTWEHIRGDLPRAVSEAVVNADRTIREKFFAGQPDRLYLDRQAFTSLMEAMAASREYDSFVQSLAFHEVYVPVSQVPELAGHLRRYARFYAVELAKTEQGVVTYINLGMESFIQGAGRILKSGYVLTLDYGCNWEGMIAQDAHPHLRTYGPAHAAENQNLEPDPDSYTPSERDTSDPYRGPTLNDMTTDVNFSIMDAEGRLAGLKVAYFGAQAALQAETPIRLDSPPVEREQYGGLIDEFHSWAASFQSDANYKLMVQQKQGTDAEYGYPERKAEKLASDESSLNEKQLERLERMLARLTGADAAKNPKP
jgi:SAM-dependent MidA family methyltransferase